MPDLRGLMADPEFNALPMERRKAILARINPQLAQDYGGPQSAPSVPQPAPAATGWEAIRRALFEPGSAERAEAIAPILQGVDAFAGGAAAPGVVAAGKAAPGLVRRGWDWAMAHPKTVGAVADAAPELLQGDVQGAVFDAARGYALGAAAQGAGKVVRRVRGSGLGTVENAALAVAREPAVMLNPQGKRIVVHPDIQQRLQAEGWKMAPPQAPAVRSAPPANAPEVKPEPGKPVPTKANQQELDDFARSLTTPPPPGNRAHKPEPPKAGPRPVPKTDAGREAAERHRKRVLFAKEIARTNPKAGAKIWMEIDAKGDPVRMITPGQASALPENRKTFMRNLWGDVRHLSKDLD